MTDTTTATLMRMNPGTMPDAGAIGYSQITVTEPGRLAFVSGQVAVTREERPIPERLSDQADIALRNAEAALDALAAGPADLVMVRVYVVDLTPARLAELMPKLQAFFDGAQPSLTGIGVAALAGEGLQVEIEMVVRVPE